MADQKHLHIPLATVKSSNVSGLGFHPQSNTLAVRFANGGIYHYDDVPADVVAQFKAAESKGSYFAKHIRGKFTSKKIAVDPS